MNSTSDQVAELLARYPSPKDYRHLRVRWLLEIAAALDSTAIDGAADLATTARDLALALITDTVAHVGRCAA